MNYGWGFSGDSIFLSFTYTSANKMTWEDRQTCNTKQLQRKVTNRETD